MYLHATRTLILRLVPLILLLLVTQVSRAQFDTLPPFTIEIEPVTNASVPGLHSFAFAQSGSKWLLVGGRTNGLHGFSSNDGFPTQYANNELVVIDTAGWQFWTAALTNLPDSVADPLRSTNMEHWQEGNYLYMIGGYGYDSVQNKYVTFPRLSALRVDSIIDAVVTGSSFSQYIRQVKDTNLAICGGELVKYNSDYYLVFGHFFQGRYTDPPTSLFIQRYSNKIKKFNIIDTGTSLSISNYSETLDTANFHRRDLNVGPMVNTNGSLSWNAYGGVFTPNMRPWRAPVEITASPVNVSSYQQVMSQYTCALMPVYDSVLANMHTTFFGGISLYDYDPASNTVNMDTMVPFISDVTTLTKYSTGQYAERVMPVQLPGLLGSNAKFIVNENISLYSNEVIKLRSLTGRTLAGYMYGGIRTNLPNIGFSTVNDTIYRVYITPDYSNGIAEQLGGVELFQLVPNPAADHIKVMIKLAEASEVIVELYDVTGKREAVVFNGKADAGVSEFYLNTSQLPQGIHLCRLATPGGTSTVKLVIMK